MRETLKMIETLKLMLGIKDDSKDELLMSILHLCQSPVLSYINEVKLPAQLEWVIIEMSIIRFNKIKSEGLTSESIDGGSVSFIDNAFNLYKQDLDTYIANKNNNRKGATFY